MPTTTSLDVLQTGVSPYLRADAALAKSAVYQYLKNHEVLHAIRIKANAVLEHNIEHLLHRRVACPSKKPEPPLRGFSYLAKTWGRPRRVVAKVERHIGELFPRVGFIVTSLKHHARKRDRWSATYWPRCCASH